MVVFVVAFSCSGFINFGYPLSNYHLIFLFFIKVIIRIITDHLGNICSSILSQNQFGFVKECNGRDAIVGAAECFSDLHKRSFGGGMAIKIDI